MTTASDICRAAADIVAGAREAQHGKKERNHHNIAIMWNAYMQKRGFTGVELTPEDVALMMVLLKVARTNFGSYNPDDYVDMAGYAGCAGEIADAEKQSQLNLEPVRTSKPKRELPCPPVRHFLDPVGDYKQSRTEMLG